MVADSRYKRARVTFDGWVSEYKDVIYLYTAVPNSTDPDHLATVQAGALRPLIPNLMLTIAYASVYRTSELHDRYRDPKVRDPYAPPALEDRYRDPDSPDYAYSREDEGHVES